MSDIKVARGISRAKAVLSAAKRAERAPDERVPEEPVPDDQFPDDPYDPVMRVFMHRPDGTVEQRVGTASQVIETWQEHSIGAVLEVTTTRKLHRKRSSPTDVFCVSSPDQVAGQWQSPYEYRVGPAGELTISAGGKMVVVYAPGGWREIEPSRLTGPAEVAANPHDVDVELHTSSS